MNIRDRDGLAAVGHISVRNQFVWVNQDSVGFGERCSIEIDVDRRVGDQRENVVTRHVLKFFEELTQIYAEVSLDVVIKRFAHFIWNRWTGFEPKIGQEIYIALEIP